MADKNVGYSFGPFTFHKRGGVLLKGETRIHLRPQAAKLLFLLLDQCPAAVPRTKIGSHLWERGAPPEIDVDQQINTCIRLIRRALNDPPKAPAYIATHKDGYQFIGPVSEIADQAAKAKPTDPIRLEPSERVELEQLGRSTLRRFEAFILKAGMLAAATGFWWAALNGSYGIAILMCGIGCVLLVVMYRRSEDTVPTRAAVAVVLTAAMAYIPSAATLPQVVDSVVDATTLKPAVIYPFITGLKFIPLFCVVLLEWVLLPLRRVAFPPWFNSRSGYFLRGTIVLLVTAIALVWNSGEDRIFRSSLPGSRVILVGYAVVLFINLGLWFLAYGEFAKENRAGFTPLLLTLAFAYLPLALAGFIIDQKYNFINLHYLDKRRPTAYRVVHPQAVEAFKGSSAVRREIGPDLMLLINDPAFARTLKTEQFYRQDFDDLFQFGDRSLMFGYKAASLSKSDPRFIIVRFPEKMAAALGFQPVSP